MLQLNAIGGSLCGQLITADVAGNLGYPAFPTKRNRFRFSRSSRRSNFSSPDSIRPTQGLEGRRFISSVPSTSLGISEFHLPDSIMSGSSNIFRRLFRWPLGGGRAGEDDSVTEVNPKATASSAVY